MLWLRLATTRPLSITCSNHAARNRDGLLRQCSDPWRRRRKRWYRPRASASQRRQHAERTARSNVITRSLHSLESSLHQSLTARAVPHYHRHIHRNSNWGRDAVADYDFAEFKNGMRCCLTPSSTMRKACAYPKQHNWKIIWSTQPNLPEPVPYNACSMYPSKIARYQDCFCRHIRLHANSREP